MPGVLSRFQENFPRIRVYLMEGSSQEIADGLVEFKYDLGIIGRLPHEGKLKAIPFTKEEFCLVTPPGHRFAEMGTLSIRDLEHEPIIIREEGSGSRHAILSLLSDHHVKPSVLVEAGSVEFIKEYVMKGRGVSFLYKPEVELEAKMGLLIPLLIQEGPILLQTDIVFPRQMDLSPTARAFLKLIEPNS